MIIVIFVCLWFALNHCCHHHHPHLYPTIMIPTIYGHSFFLLNFSVLSLSLFSLSHICSSFVALLNFALRWWWDTASIQKKKKKNTFLFLSLLEWGANFFFWFRFVLHFSSSVPHQTVSY